MIFSPSEREWIRRRAEQIALERGLPLPIAQSHAMAQLTRDRASGRQARVLEFRAKRP